MKTIIIPIILLIAAMVFIIWSGIAVDNSLKGLIEQTKDLPDTPNENTLKLIEDIEKHWNKHKELYSAVIKFDFIYNFSKEISAAKAGVNAEDTGTYLAAKKSLLNILEYIRDVQKLRIDNLI
ncbi:MAG: DUF4363 family protein [Clostridia bacterium]|nr:DUF4363 family protein [Clostridia bacterium]